MSHLIAASALILGVSGDIKYPAICIPRYLSEEKIENVAKVEITLVRKPSCEKIGEETITEGDRAGETFSIFTCCTSL